MRTETIETADRILIFAGDHHEAQADVFGVGSAVYVRFHDRGSHVDPQLGPALVAAVCDLPQLRDRRQLRASVPIGDADVILQLARRFPTLRTRAAGATCLIDAEIEH